MPRERIQHGKFFIVEQQDAAISNETVTDDLGRREWHPGQILNNEQILQEESSVDVLWTRDEEDVRVGIEAPRDWWDRFYDFVKAEDSNISHTVVSERLTRKEINHMIRTLRRARDAAYGSDE